MCRGLTYPIKPGEDGQGEGGLGLGLARAEPLMDKSLRTQLVISGHKQLSDSYRAKRDFGIE